MLDLKPIYAATLRTMLGYLMLAGVPNSVVSFFTSVVRDSILVAGTHRELVVQ